MDIKSTGDAVMAFVKQMMRKSKDAYDSAIHCNILLLTNVDSDNVGDQVIEACDVGLLKAVMQNLGIGNYQIISRPAAVISRKYLETRNPKSLDEARRLIKKSNMLIFGGAPMFNYLYQRFYERTTVWIELAQEYNIPVIFSAIGIESYDEDNPKCQRLKKALNLDCVKQISTRDRLDLLEKYKVSEHLHIEQVADPAVVSKTVFRNQLKSKGLTEKKKVGIFVLRAYGFKDNKIDFSKQEAIDLWLGLIHELEKRGYNYELLTSGFWGDETILDYLVRKCNVSLKRCVFNMGTPEKLNAKISGYDAVISCRLHPSIISFALDVPSVGLIWNPKVQGFYNSIGYADRAISVTESSPEAIVDKVEQVMQEGVKKDPDYIYSIYLSLFKAVQKYTGIGKEEVQPFGYPEFLQYIPEYKSVSKKELDGKIDRKLRRIYEKHNECTEKNERLKEEVKQLRAEVKLLKKKTKNKTNGGA